MDFSRRKLLIGGGSAGMSLLLAGCCRIKLSPLNICSTAPPLAPPVNGNFAIDIHAHFFNGTDLQVRAFISRNANLPYPQELKEIAGALIEALTWTFAPTGRQEYQELSYLSACKNAAGRVVRTQQHREKSFRDFLKEARRSTVYKEYQTSAAKTRRANGMTGNVHAQYIDAIGHLLDAESTTDYIRRRQSIPNLGSATINLDDVLDLLKFLNKGFNYRYINLEDYLATYNPVDYHGRSIDLVVSNMVDYDWPLSKGSATKTPFQDQVSVMERLSIYSHGRVHAMVPFDPMRQVAIDAGFTPETGRDSHFTFDEIKKERGCIGVKLYPVMGFLPIGNQALPVGTWSVDWLPDWMSQPITISGQKKNFGEWLDIKLGELYAWAEQNGVPITTHADPSQGPSTSFNIFALGAWATVAEQYPNLRLNLGHSDDATGSGDPVDNIFSTLSGPDTDNQYVYGDFSYPEGILQNPTGYAPLLERYLKAQYPDPQHIGHAADLSDRLMYGTDWLMFLLETHSEDCLTISENALRQVDADLPHEGRSYSDRFFALNAVRFLGLERGKPARKRLEDFYQKNGMNITTDPPSWMKKVDALI